MHEFKYKTGELYCEDIRIADLARRFGTPFYLYSHKTLKGHYLKLKSAFREIEPLICYSVKANSNLSILKALVACGAGLDIVSGGELFRALRAGCPAKKIVYASVGKTDAEIEEAMQKGILFFNVESIPELENINRIAKRQNKSANIAIRINPDIEPKTHKFITTGKLTNKFGIDLDTAGIIFKKRARFSNLNISGLHIHIGSQITQGDPFIAAIMKVSNFISELKKEGVNLKYLNIGGGLGIVYDKETPQTAKIFAAKVLPILKKTGLKVIMEPGRFIIGNAGVLVTKVLYVKKTPKKKFVIVDGGMNDLIRPALYDAYHQVLPLRNTPRLRSGQAHNDIRNTQYDIRYTIYDIRYTERVDVVGPICESGDFFAKDRQMPYIKEGDYLAVMSAGAYGFSMASNYNSRKRPAEVMVKSGRAFLIRKRETYEDLIKNEGI